MFELELAAEFVERDRPRRFGDVRHPVENLEDALRTGGRSLRSVHHAAHHFEFAVKPAAEQYERDERSNAETRLTTSNQPDTASPHDQHPETVEKLD